MTIDTSKPHIGRIYDFMLGGQHNYEADRRAAAEILKTAPTYPKWARANRWFLQFVATEWAQAGRRQVLDLGTGLPTEGHFNDLMPDARILFTDNDPISVAYGHGILAGDPNMDYVLADVSEPETVVRRLTEFFAGDHDIAIGCIGVAYMVPDAPLAALLAALHAWCAPGSVLALTFGTWVRGGDRAQASAAMESIRRNANTQMYIRTTEELCALAAPWRLVTSRPLTEWLDAPEMFTREELEAQGASMDGAFFER